MALYETVVATLLCGKYTWCNQIADTIPVKFFWQPKKKLNKGLLQ